MSDPAPGGVPDEQHLAAGAGVDRRDHGIDVVGTITNYLTTAAAESAPAHQADRLRAVMRHAWISDDQAAEFWSRAFELVNEASLPREGTTAYGFVAGLYPTEHPTLPDAT